MKIATTLRRHPSVLIGAGILILIAVLTVLAPLIATHDPQEINPMMRLRGISSANWLGTDSLGRDVWSRAVYGGRISLIVGLVVALFATTIGLLVGLISGFNRFADAILMRAMDGLMAIPAILLAVALMALSKASVMTVIFAITVVEVPRVARLVRSVVLSIREQAYVEAATVVGSRFWRMLWRHVVPNTLAPLTVQATYICAAAILIESLLSFLGAGTPPAVPSWGNIMAEGRIYFQISPLLILTPGLFLATTVLAVNLMGDGLRDMLDPAIARRMTT